MDLLKGKLIILTPTIYNGWEQITEMDLTDGFAQPVNIDETKDYMPEMGPMIG